MHEHVLHEEVLEPRRVGVRGLLHDGPALGASVPVCRRDLVASDVDEVGGKIGATSVSTSFTSSS